jgi:N-formylglutamate amidohydrolase
MGDQIVFPARAPRHDDNGVQSLVQARVSDAFLPIILTAPHGGKEATGDQVSYLEARPEFEKNIRIVADVGTAQLLEAIDAQLLLKTGHACFSVVARFHRKFIDANRDFRDPEAIAFVPVSGSPLLLPSPLVTCSLFL